MWRDSRICDVRGEAPGGAGRGRRARSALWGLLHAQALLDGGAGSTCEAAVVENDRRRLTARQAQ
jgi:hypothetical protein